MKRTHAQARIFASFDTGKTAGESAGIQVLEIASEGKQYVRNVLVSIWEEAGGTTKRNGADKEHLTARVEALYNWGFA